MVRPKTGKTKAVTCILVFGLSKNVAKLISTNQTPKAMGKVKELISENTGVSLLVLIFIGVPSAGGIAWLANIDAKASAIERLENKLDSIDHRLSRIEGKLEK